MCYTKDRRARKRNNSVHLCATAATHGLSSCVQFVKVAMQTSDEFVVCNAMGIVLQDSQAFCVAERAPSTSNMEMLPLR
jgi:hypothetical protein